MDKISPRLNYSLWIILSPIADGLIDITNYVCLATTWRYDVAQLLNWQKQIWLDGIDALDKISWIWRYSLRIILPWMGNRQRRERINTVDVLDRISLIWRYSLRIVSSRMVNRQRYQRINIIDVLEGISSSWKCSLRIILIGMGNQ